MSACVRCIRLRERSCVQMFLMKHIVRRVKPPIMNSSSVCEKAAVEGSMGTCAADRGAAAPTAVCVKARKYAEMGAEVRRHESLVW